MDSADDDIAEMNALAAEALPSWTELVETVTELANEVKRLKARAERRKIWNWWKATEEQKAEWIAMIDEWLKALLLPDVPTDGESKICT